jgi:hypothetical protein
LHVRRLRLDDNSMFSPAQNGKLDNELSAKSVRYPLNYSAIVTKRPISFLSVGHQATRVMLTGLANKRNFGTHWSCNVACSTLSIC